MLEATPLKLFVVNAQHIKALPGRKTDVKDAEWIANLLRHGLLQGCYIMRRGAKRAAVALAHTLLTTIYHLLTDGTVYTDLGGNYFDERDRDATLRRSVRRIERLGYKVTVEAA